MRNGVLDRGLYSAGRPRTNRAVVGPTSTDDHCAVAKYSSSNVHVGAQSKWLHRLDRVRCRPRPDIQTRPLLLNQRRRQSIFT
jgi:hypothetical protein